MTVPMSDEERLEASSVKYRGVTTVALSTGRIAVMDHFSNEDGLPVLAAFGPDDWAELLAMLKKHAEWEPPRPAFVPKPKRGERLSLTLDDLGL